MSSVRVSIIIATCNRGASLRRTLASLNELRVPKDCEGEVILVDNGSSDNTQTELRAFAHSCLRFVPLFQSRKGKSNALNTGIEAARGEFLLFTDDDVDVPPEWIEAMLPYITSHDAVVGSVRLDQSLERPWMTTAHRWLLAVQQDADSPILIGANMAIRKSVFQTISAFDSELGPGALGLGEEFLLGSQMRRAGRRIAFAPEVAVVHRPDTSRLKYDAWVKGAYACGRSGAYIDYHWEHSVPAKPTIRELTARIKLCLAGANRTHAAPGQEGCPERKIQMAKESAYWKQLRRERMRPRLYEKYGLRKLS